MSVPVTRWISWRMQGFLTMSLLAGPMVAFGQVVRLGAPRPLLTAGNLLTVNCLPSTMTFALTPGAVTAGSGNVAITTTWSGVSLVASLQLYAYFSSPASALTGGTSPVTSISSAHVLGSMSTGTPTSFTAFTQTGPFGTGGSLLLLSVGSLLSLSGNRTDSLALEIDLSTLPQTPAAVYSGTLYLQAQEF